MNFEKDKIVEKDRYNLRAKNNFNVSQKFTIKNIPVFLRKPYEVYIGFINENIKNNYKVLELAAGMGEHTDFLVKTGANITACDISNESLNILKKNYEDKIKVIEADMENLPFKNDSFDIVCCAGSMSYADQKIVCDEIFRVLKKNGKFICVDSLNYNIIYRVNRYIHYLRGERSKSTIRRIPGKYFFKTFKENFFFEKIEYFGQITWLAPILKRLIGVRLFTNLSDWFDKNSNLKYLSFKFVLVAKKL